MFNAKRLFCFLSTGVVPEMSALDEAIARFAEAQDEIDFEKHDRRYHGGKFNPDTMTCGMREALENGDLADVIAAERQEATDFDRKRRVFNLQNAELKAQRRAQHEQALLRKQRRMENESERAKSDRELQHRIHLRETDPRDLTTEEFNIWYGKTNDRGANRLEYALRKMFVPSEQDKSGTILGMVDGKIVTAHKLFHEEFTRSRNAFWHRRKDKEGWFSKVRMILDFEKLFKTARDHTYEPYEAHNSRHKDWMVAKGFQRSKVTWEGREWEAVFACPNDNELILYDIVG